MQLTSAASRCGSSAAARHSLAAAPRPCAVAALPPTASSRARGAFIVIEGLDRAGKSTQVANLQSALEAEGLRCKTTRSPDRDTVIGGLLSAALKGQTTLPPQAMHLLFAANRWEKLATLLHCMDSGVVVITDRYSYSGVAYSQAQGLSAEWCKASEAGLPAPDLVVFLQLSPAAAAQRADYGGELYESIQLQEKVAEAFRELPDQDWLLVDAAQTEQAVTGQILPAVRAAIQRCQQGAPLRQLWDRQPLRLTE